ncbi:SpoIID/LytB domain-containing protein [Aerosakkonemataceae cyanobacterium BLCC-F154]|uniref:SpoIID/LytB domain-containing protein n=1 Tax=Floridaenema fluviatile BLCC-F154 TaxID=3153640 RepID=A0ABV4YCR9_9CYAN
MSLNSKYLGNKFLARSGNLTEVSDRKTAMKTRTYNVREIQKRTQPRVWAWLINSCHIVVTVTCVLGIGTAGLTQQRGVKDDVELQVGIVQRFGEDLQDRITLEATEGDRLTLRFLAGNMKPTTLAVEKIQLQIAMQPLPEPKLEERVVLSNHPNFETAEDAANQWRSRGIQVEIAQPTNRWQVWARRDVYSNAVVRRLLLQTIQAQGMRTAYLDTKVIDRVPKVFWAVNGLGYNRQNVEISAQTGLIRVNAGKTPRSARLYYGSLKIQPNAYGNYTLVNQVPLETYLRGVVPYEIGAGAPRAAVEAQAIIARTYALRNLRRFAIDNYELCADVHCQVYFGLKGATANTDRAIATTRGLVLTYDNQLVDALYSSTTGGITASFSDVWNGPDRPYLQSVLDTTKNVWDLSRYSLADEQNVRRFIGLKTGFNEERESLFRWRYESKLPDITQQLQKYLASKKHPLANLQSIQKMEVTERAESGRILQMNVHTDRGVVELHKEEVRSAFKPPRSSFFYLEPLKNPNQELLGYAFVGAGFGHGVGLSQTGASQLARLGWSSQQILNFYYPGAKLEPLNESIIFWQEPPNPAKSS